MSILTMMISTGLLLKIKEGAIQEGDSVDRPTQLICISDINLSTLLTQQTKDKAG